MKKIITAVTALILSAFLFTACSSESLSFDGMYWNKSGEYFTFQNVQEICTYSLSVEHVTEADKNVVKNDNITMVLDPSSSYVTTLSAVNEGGKDCYKFTTRMLLNGSYTVLDKTLEFENDEVVTETLFKLKADNFLPYYSKRTSTCSYVALDDDNNLLLNRISYEQLLEYNGNTVTATITPTLDELGQLDGVKGVKEYKIDKDNYIDNELITFLPRAFNLSDGLYQKFKTIDALPNLSRKMIYSTMGNDNVTIANIDVSGYKLNGREVNYTTLNATRVFINIDDTFSGAPIEVYYAKDDETAHHQRMLLAYSRINSNIGYIKYTLKSTDTNVL